MPTILIETDFSKLQKRAKNLSGKKFQMITVLSFAGITTNRSACWNCICDCGKEFQATGSNLKKQVSCGCEARKNKIISATTHGMTNTSEFNIWLGIRKRCRSKNDKYYSRYGGRGIDVCDSWFNSFEAFYADMGPRPQGLSIDRVDNSKGYNPSNCRWASIRQQQRNKRSNNMVTHNGERLCLTEWSERTGIRKDTLRLRIFKYGWSINSALTISTGGRRL